jgi:hypothetical protein
LAITRGELERKLRGDVSNQFEKEALRLTGAMADFARSVELAVAGNMNGAADALIGCRTTWGSRNVYNAALLYASKTVTELAQATGKSPRKTARRISDEGLTPANVVKALGEQCAPTGAG